MAYRPPYLPLWPMANFTINHDILYAEPAHVPGSCHQWMEVRGTYLPFVIPPPPPRPITQLRSVPSGPAQSSFRPASLPLWLPLAQIPEAWLLLANVVVVLILVPVKDHLLDPLLLRCKLLPSALQKMALGMFFGFASVIVAGVRA